MNRQPHDSPPPLRSRVKPGSIVAWAIGIPLAALALASAATLGGQSARVMILMLTFGIGFLAPLVVAGESGIRGWAADAARLAGPVIGCWLAVAVLDPDLLIRAGALLTGLAVGWFGAARILCGMGASGAVRGLVLGLLNAAVCSTPFWGGAIVEAAQGGARTTLLRWLVSGNPVLTASNDVLGQDPILLPMMYFQKLSVFADYHGRLVYGTVKDVCVLGAATLLTSILIPVSVHLIPRARTPHVG